MSLDVDGILHVTAIEKVTGKSKHVTIANALAEKSPQETAAARERNRALYADRAQEEDGEAGPAPVVEMPARPTVGSEEGREAQALVERSRHLLDRMHQDDVEEVVELHEKIVAALAQGDDEALRQATGKLRELLLSS